MEEISTNIQPAEKEHKKIKLIHIFLFLLILSVVFNVFLVSKMTSLNMGISGASFRYINSIENQPIDSNSQDNNLLLHYKGLKDIINGEIEEYNATGKIALFLQDVKTGASLGINEKEGFSPASLLKIPIMMVILKKVERGEIGLKDPITIIPEDIDSQWGNLYEKGAGAKITIQQLLEEMITYSDNTAKNALKRQLSLTEIDTVFIHVGIPDPYLATNGNAVSPRGYTRLLKSLYYSTFLSPALSEKALEFMTDTQQENLISRGVPPEVQVAHKFGISGLKSLHDCGIVYHQKNPYFLCIMTRDIQLEQSSELIRKISKEVYEFVDAKS